jgi:hypothetical protein
VTMTPPVWQSNIAEALRMRGLELWPVKTAGTILADRFSRCHDIFPRRNESGSPSTLPLWLSAPVLNSSMVGYPSRK